MGCSLLVGLDRQLVLSGAEEEKKHCFNLLNPCVGAYHFLPMPHCLPVERGMCNGLLCRLPVLIGAEGGGAD